MQIYVHEQNAELKLVEVEETITVEELASADGEEGADFVWIEDAEEALETPTTLVAAGIDERSHVHISRCHRINVRMRYGGDSKSREFAPSATIAGSSSGRPASRASRTHFERARKHTLGICDTLTERDKSEHIGSLANRERSVALILLGKSG